MEKEENKKVAVLIPCLNEALTIGSVIREYQRVLPEADIYVYDNGSTDQTAEISQKLGVIVRYEYRRGKGNVIRTMFREIEADVYLLVDGDNTYPANPAKEMVRLVLEEGADVVTGDRLSSTYFIENKRHFHNMGNRVVRFLINKLFQSNIKDVMTGYRACSKLFVKSFPALSEGFEIETEMTVHALDKKFIYREIPVAYRDREEGSYSKLHTFSDGWKVLHTIICLFRDYRPFCFFSWMALICWGFAVVYFIPVLLEYRITGLVPRFPTLIVSVTAAVIGTLIWICGITLEVVIKKHRQLYELWVRQLSSQLRKEREGM